MLWLLLFLLKQHVAAVACLGMYIFTEKLYVSHVASCYFLCVTSHCSMTKFCNQANILWSREAISPDWRTTEGHNSCLQQLSMKVTTCCQSVLLQVVLCFGRTPHPQWLHQLTTGWTSTGCRPHTSSYRNLCVLICNDDKMSL